MKDIKYQYAYDESNTLVSIKDYTKESSKLHTFKCIAIGGKFGRKKGSVKSTEQKKEEYKEVISFLKRGYSVRNTAKFCFHEPTVARQIK